MSSSVICLKIHQKPIRIQRWKKSEKIRLTLTSSTTSTSNKNSRFAGFRSHSHTKVSKTSSRNGRRRERMKWEWSTRNYWTTIFMVSMKWKWKQWAIMCGWTHLIRRSRAEISGYQMPVSSTGSQHVVDVSTTPNYGGLFFVGWTRMGDDHHSSISPSTSPLSYPEGLLRDRSSTVMITLLTA